MRGAIALVFFVESKKSTTQFFAQLKVMNHRVEGAHLNELNNAQDLKYS